MPRALHVLIAVTSLSLGACDSKLLRFDPTGPGVVPTEPVDCPAVAEWLSSTTPPQPPMQNPAPHPQTECPFFQASFQQFLGATQPGADGDPALVRYATIDDAFVRARPLGDGALAATGSHRGTPLRAWLGYIKQPGARALLIDQRHHAIYYGIHLNEAFVTFIGGQGLATSIGVQNADPGLTLPSGVVAIKSAWMDIEPADGVTGDFSTFITTTAWVARVHQDLATRAISEDRDHPRQIRVALVALDLAFGMPGHPELIWASFQHVGPQGDPDVTPVGIDSANPSAADPGNQRVAAAPSGSDFMLYHGGTAARLANTPWAESSLLLDETTQAFAQTTSIYRMYPVSRSHTVDEKSEVLSLNQHVRALFAQQAAQLDPADRRGAYSLMGGIWMDKPGDFALDAALQNDSTSPFVTGAHVDQEGQMVAPVPPDRFQASLLTDGSDSPYSILGGYDRLSNPGIESFTQSPGNFNNCLTCHNTTAPTALGVPGERDPADAPLMAPKLINVSHVFSQFILEECGPSGLCPAP